MPRITSRITHDLGRAEAIRRLKDACEWAHGVSDLRESWSGDVLSFSASIQGVRVGGEVAVTDAALEFAGDIPLIALAFKGWIPTIFRNALKERKKPEAAPATAPVLLYLHIPKAGGGTLGEFIFNQCKSEDDADEGLVKNGVFFFPDGFLRTDEADGYDRMGAILRRNDLRAVTGHFAFGIHERLARPFHYVTVLRDPVRRLVSLYHFMKLDGRMSLAEFVQTPPFREVDNDQTRRIAGLTPGAEAVTERDLETGKRNLSERFAAVGTTERMDEMLVLLKHRLGWTKEVAAPPRNVGGGAFAAPDAAATEMIRTKNRYDLELHRFANDLMDRMIGEAGSTFPEALSRQRALNTIPG